MRNHRERPEILKICTAHTILRWNMNKVCTVEHVSKSNIFSRTFFLFWLRSRLSCKDFVKNGCVNLSTRLVPYQTFIASCHEKLEKIRLLRIMGQKVPLNIINEAVVIFPLIWLNSVMTKITCHTLRFSSYYHLRKFNVSMMKIAVN